MKYILSLLIALLVISPLHASQKKDALLLAITSGHTRVFSRDNLIVSRLTSGDLSVWNDTVKAVKQFVEKNSDKKTANLIAYFKSISSISDDLINRLKVAFNGVIAPALVNSKDKKEGLSRLDASKIDLEKIDVNGLQNVIKPLEESRDKLIKIQNDLSNDVKKLKGSKLDAAQVLTRLAITLEATITKVINDTKKLATSVANISKSNSSQIANDAPKQSISTTNSSEITNDAQQQVAAIANESEVAKKLQN
jgi:hypothetical protein